MQKNRFILSTRLTSLFSQPSFSAPCFSLTKFNIGLWFEKRKSQLQTSIWNYIQWFWLLKVMLLCWGSVHGHRWIKWRLVGASKLLEVIYPTLNQDHLWWWHSWQTLSSLCLTALVPLPVQVILFSFNLCNRSLFPLCGNLLKTHVTPPAFFNSAQILSIFLQSSCFLYLQSF